MKVLVVDDHSLFRAGLRLLIQTIRPNTTVLEAHSIDDALSVSREHPDLRLCLLDIHLSQENGLDALSRIKSSAPEIAVVVVSAEDSLQAVAKSIDSGAMGFIPKRSNPQELALALTRVLNGDLYVPIGLSASLPSEIQDAPGLSKRQWDVFHCLMRGLPNKLICRELDLSENTVKTHLAAIFRAFDVHTRTQLLIVASKIRDLPRGSDGGD